MLYQWDYLVTKLIINILILFFLFSCQIENVNKFKDIEEIPKIPLMKEDNTENINSNNLKYIVGLPYFIKGVKYTPEENYKYNQVGLANFYSKELHNKKTINNDYNKVTELLGRHKTLPIPSIVKITNLENGLFLTLKINDRNNDNSYIIQVSRKSAQLLKFYKNKIARVKVEILPDPSKQMKVVIKSMSKNDFNQTVNSAPTEGVLITNIDESNIDISNKNIIKNKQLPIEIGFTEIESKKLFLKVFNFKSLNEAKSILSELNIKNDFTTENSEGSISLIIGPLSNIEANNLVLSFISRGYKNTKFIFE